VSSYIHPGRGKFRSDLDLAARVPRMHDLCTECGFATEYKAMIPCNVNVNFGSLSLLGAGCPVSHVAIATGYIVH
jgi:hypothetical protein